MGLNIGITVKRQPEHWGSEGYNPKGSAEDIEADVNDYVRRLLSDMVINHVSVFLTEEAVEFDVRKPNDTTKMYQALACYVIERFSPVYGIDMKIWWS